MREARRSQWPDPLASRATKQTAGTSAPDSVSRSVVREGAQAAARNTVKRGAHAAAPAPQASLTVSRQPSLRVAAKCGVCVVALLGFVVRATTFVARLASIRILPATQSAEDLIRGSLSPLPVMLSQIPDHGHALEIRESLIRSYEGATLAFRDEMRDARRSEWLTPFASRATKQVARKGPSHPGFGAMRRLNRCAPRA